MIKRPEPVAVGTIVWLGSEVMFFAGLFAIYFTLRVDLARAVGDRDRAAEHPVRADNTIILVLSSFTCQIGVFAAERFQPYSHAEARLARLGHGRVVLPHLRPGRDLRLRPGLGVRHSSSPRASPINSNSYGSAFYLTTGFHGLHVTGGLIAFLLVIGRAFAVKNFGTARRRRAIVVSYYWHFVDVVWIGLFLVIYVLK